MQWGLLISPLGSPWDNMATDEYLLSVANERRTPVLRCYGWDMEAMSFGYFQSYEEIAALTPVRPLVRRLTGGGLVSHVSNFHMLSNDTNHWCWESQRNRSSH